MAYNTKRGLIIILVLVGIFKLLSFGASVYGAIAHNNTYSMFTVSITAFYLAVNLFGFISACKERPCGLKVFSVVQTFFVVISILGISFSLFGSTPLIPEKTGSVTMENSQGVIPLTKYDGENVLDNKKEGNVMDNEVPLATLSKPPCKFRRVLPFIVLGVSVFVAILDFVSAILAWRGFQQLVATDQAIQTFTYLSESNDDEIPMTPAQPQPLNVVYVPANLYDPTQSQMYQ